MSRLVSSQQTVLYVKRTLILTKIASVTNHNLARIVAGNAGLIYE